MDITYEGMANISIRGGQIVLQGEIEIHEKVLEKLDYLAGKDTRNVGLPGKRKEILQKALKSFLDPELKRHKIRSYAYPGKELALKQEEEQRVKKYKNGIATLKIRTARLDLEIDNLKKIPDTEDSIKLLVREQKKFKDKQKTMTRIFDEGTKRFKEGV